MKKIHIFFLFLFSSLISVSLYAQTKNEKLTVPLGEYRASNGVKFFVKADGSFYILKGRNKAFDAVLPGCDTIAKGMWNIFSKSILRLSNDSSFRRTRFNVMQEARLSKDSIYIVIDLPKDETFSDGRFRYQVTLMPKIDFLESTNHIIIIPKKKLYENDNLYYHLGLTIQDLAPLNCKLNGKCYQRIFFTIFDDYRLSTKWNYFTVKLPSFNDCYVEQADVDNQLVFVSDNKVYWQDVEFSKVK